MTNVMSTVTTDVDFDRRGKQFGMLRIPYSDNRSAYGQILTPIAVLAGGEGPTLLFFGGVHGDEPEGPIALMDFCRTIDVERLKGRIVVVPALNLPAVEAGTRCCPLDNKNLNRVFPGDAAGSFAEVIAHYVVTHLFPLADVVVDFHSGGSTLRYIPAVIVHHFQGELTQSIAAARAFGAPMILISRDLEVAGFLGNTAEASGILTVTTELGGGPLSPEIMRIATQGLANLVRFFGLLEHDTADAVTMSGRGPAELVEIESLDGYMVATERGLYEPVCNLGDEVKVGSVVGKIHRPGHPWDPPILCVSALEGKIICVRPTVNVLPGDCVAIVGRVSTALPDFRRERPNYR